MRLRRSFYGAVGAVALLMLGTGMMSCGKKKKSTTSDEDTSKIMIAGQLALAGESTSLALTNPALNELKVYCVTFAIPPVAGEGGIDTEGKFELSLESTDASVGCFILKNTDILGTIVFEDSTKKGLSGDNQATDRQGLTGGRTDLGTFTLDLSTGKAVVDITKITTGKVKDTSNVEGKDFSGSYKAAQVDFTLPDGYEGICTDPNDKDCSGPRDGDNLFLKTLKGKSVADGKPAYGMMIWAAEQAFKSCGEKLGFSYEDGKKLGIDLTDSGVAEGGFTWSAGYEDGWKKSDAKAKWGMMKMEPVEDFHGYPGQKQWFKKYRTWDCPPGQPCTESAPIEKKGFQFNANTKETGCKDAAGKPVRLDDWSNMQCENTDLGNGLHKNTCKKDTVTCINIGGTYDEAGAPMTQAMVRYPDDFEVYAAPGALCSSIDTSKGEAAKVAQLRCYAEALHGGDGGEEFGRDSRDVNSCIRRINGNWSAKTADEFLGESGAVKKAENLYVFNSFQYDSANSGTLRGEDRYFNGVQVGNNWTDCEVHEVFSITLRAIDGSNDLIAEMRQTERNVSPKPACIAEFGEAKSSKSMFKLIKQ